MSKFRKKPVVVEASLWLQNGDHPLDWAAPQIHPADDGDLILDGVRCREYSAAYQALHDWEGAVVRRFRHPDVTGETPCKHCGKTMHVHGWIDTLEGGHIVCPGDWVITGVQGEHYPCKPDVFRATYEPA